MPLLEHGKNDVYYESIKEGRSLFSKVSLRYPRFRITLKQNPIYTIIEALLSYEIK